MWERNQGLDLETSRFLQRIARDLAWPTDPSHTVQYMTDVSALMMKNFPEVTKPHRPSPPPFAAREAPRSPALCRTGHTVLPTL